MCSKDLFLMKARLVETALSLYESFYSDQSPFGSLTTSEFKAFMHLPKNKNIVLQKADKGNTTVILDNDHTKFSKLDNSAGNKLYNNYP